jgi:transposase, IS5 family
VDRCHLKGEVGDRLHAVLCAAGYNIKWLLRMIVKKGVPFLQRLYLRLCSIAGVQRTWWLTLNTWLTGTPRWLTSRAVGV